MKHGKKKKFDFKVVGTKVVGVAAGAEAGLVIDKITAGMNIDPALKGAGKIILGALVPEFIKGEFMESMGSGLIATGVIDLNKKFVPSMITGVGQSNKNNKDNAMGEVDVIDEDYRVSGDYVEVDDEYGNPDNPGNENMNGVGLQDNALGNFNPDDDINF